MQSGDLRLSVSPRLVSLLLVVGLGGCTDLPASADSSPAAAATSATAIAVTMRNFEVVLDPNTVAAGEVTFDVTFDGFHNFVVYRTDLAPDDLPLTAEGAVDPSAEGVELITFLPPGQSSTESVTVGLEPGNYVIVCTVVDHYGRGMRTRLQVTE